MCPNYSFSRAARAIPIKRPPKAVSAEIEKNKNAGCWPSAFEKKTKKITSFFSQGFHGSSSSSGNNNNMVVVVVIIIIMII